MPRKYLAVELSDVEWKPVEEIWGGAGLDVASGAYGCVLSEDAENGATTSLVKTPPGWRASGREVHSVNQEEFFIEGDVTIDGVTLHAPAYFCYPAGVAHGPGSTENGFTAIVWFDGPFDIVYPEATAAPAPDGAS